MAGGTSYTFIIPLIVGVILVIVSIFGFMLGDQANPAFWTWLLFFVGGVIIAMAILMHTAHHVVTALPAGQYYYYRPDVNIERAAVDYPRYGGPLLTVKPKCVPCRPCVPCVPKCQPVSPCGF